MNNRGFLSVSLLSLSLIFNTHAADIPTVGKFLVQAIQVIGFGAGAFHRASGGKWGAPPLTGDPQSSVGGTVAGMPMPTVSSIANTPDHGGKGTASEKKPSQSKSDREAEYTLSCWKEEIKKYDDAGLDKAIEQAEDIVKHAQGDKHYYKGTALKNSEDHIAFYQKHINQIKAEKSARAEAKAQQAQYDKSRADLAAKKAELSQQTTTVSASTAVLITQTAPVTDSTEPLMKAKEDKPQPHKRNDGPGSKKDMNDNEPPHEAKSPQLDFTDKPGQGHGAHPWRPADGHYGQKTVEAMEEVQNAITKGTFRGVKDGKFQYDWTCPETGKQVWVETIGNKVQNCGFNLEPWSVGENGFLVRPDLAGPSTGLLKGVAAVGGSVAFSSEYLAQTQEEAQNNAKKVALENRFEDIIDPYGVKKIINNSTGNLMKADSDGRIDYNDVTQRLVKNLEPKTSEVRKIMDDVVKKSTPAPATSSYKPASPYISMKTDSESLRKVMSSKPKNVTTPKFISERHKKAYANSMKPKWAKPKKD